VIVWAAAALLGAALAGLEVRRPDHRHLGLRIAAVLVTVASLAALVHPPLLPSAATRPATVLLVTPGANNSEVGRLRDSLPGVAVMRWPDSIADLDELRLRMPSLRSLHVVGWGLRESFWTGHEALQVTVHPAPLPEGVSWLAFPERVRLGDAVPIAARLSAPADGPLWLEHPDGTIDSLPSSPAGDSVARFEGRTRATGEFVYVLGGDGLSSESLHVSVLPPQPPAVLILEGSPAFETTFLRRWLADQGAAVAVRTRLSRDQFRMDRVNLPGMALGSVTAAMLDRFDLLLIDGATLQSLTVAERRVVDEAVRVGGLGMLVTPDSLARRTPGDFPFELLATGDLDGRMVRPIWSGQRGSPHAPVPALAAEIAPAARVRPVMRDPVGRIVAATAPHGAGVVGTSMITAPSRWLLEEEPTAFAAYWQVIIEALARNRSDHWALAADGPPAVDLALSLVLVTGDTLPVATVIRPDGTLDTLGLARDPAEPNRWWGRYWPVAAGWHHATNRDGEPYPFHVSMVRESAREAAARLTATARRAGTAPVASELDAVPARRPLPPLIPFLAFLVATGVLWGEGRMAVRSEQ
jgi:hypothetical protein